MMMASLSVEVGLLSWWWWGVDRAVSSEEEDVDWGAAGEHRAAASRELAFGFGRGG